MTKYEEMLARRAEASKANAALLEYPEEEGVKVLSDEDRKKSDDLETEIETLSTGIKEYEEVQQRVDRQRAREATLATVRTLRSTTPATPATLVETPDAADTLDKPKTKIRAVRSYGRLRAFKGPDAALHAYQSGQFLLAVLSGSVSAREYCKVNGVQMLTAQAEDANTLGGFLVPEQFETAIIDLREEYGVFRRESKVVPMSSDTMVIPRRKTGVTANYIGENDEIDESNATWNQVRLTVRKLAVLTRWSNELDEDAIISLADTLAGEIAYSFSLKEDQAGFLGDGTATYGGISGLITQTTTATATIVTAATGNDSFEELDLTDFEAMIGKLPQFAEIGAKWFISKAGWAASMLRLIDAAGGNTGAMIAGAAPKEFLGYPVIISQVMNSTLGTDADAYGAAYLGNLPLASTFGNRRGVTVMTSDQRYFEFDQIAIRGIERFDINVHDVGDTSVAGAMIMLRKAS